MLFKDRVMRTIASHAEVIQQPAGSTINFLSCHYGNLKAYRVKAHGRLSKDLLHDLEEYQQNTSIPVFIVSEQADRIPHFEALNRYLRWRERMKAKNNKK
jgi:hypothetical protein